MTKAKQIYDFLKAQLQSAGISIVNDVTDVQNGSIVTFEQISTNYDRKPRVPFYFVTAIYGLRIESSSKLNSIDNLLTKFDAVAEIVENNISNIEQAVISEFPGVDYVNVSSVSPDFGNPGESLIGECTISIEVKFAIKV
jgi:hypothetical protein